jgi:hypothetical protein
MFLRLQGSLNQDKSKQDPWHFNTSAVCILQKKLLYIAWKCNLFSQWSVLDVHETQWICYFIFRAILLETNEINVSPHSQNPFAFFNY